MNQDPPLQRRPTPIAGQTVRSPSGRDLLLAAALLVLLVLIAYRPTLRSDFVALDDYQYVVDNEMVRQPSLGGVYRVFSEILHPSTVKGYYQPLTMISLMIDSCLAGTTSRSIDPYVYHLTNVLFHAATTVLVFLWVRRFIGGLAIPFLMAMLFSLHPIQVESVAWISQRKTVLATFFAVAAIIAYVDSVQHHSRRWLIASVVLYALATLAKPTVLLLPLVLPLLDVWPLNRRPWSALAGKAPYAIVMLPMAYVAWSSQAESEAGLGFPNLSAAGPATRWIGLLSYNFVLYIGNLVWPMYLSPYRAIPNDLSFSNSVIAFSVLGTIAFLFAWIASWRFARPLFIGLAAFGITLAPALGVIRVMRACVADRFLYFPLFFLLLPIAFFLLRMEQRFAKRKAALFLLLMLFVVPLWILTTAQETVWRDSKSLWTQVVESDPQCEQAQSDLAAIALEEQDLDAALDRATKAHELDPESAINNRLLGQAYVRLGQANRGIPLIEMALEKGLGRHQDYGFIALGEARLCVGDENGALSAVQKAAALGYPIAKAYSIIGDAARRFAAKYALAERWYRKAVDADPQETLYRWQLAGALEYLGRYDDALQECEGALRLLSNEGVPVPDSVQRAVERIRKLAAQPSTQPAKKGSPP